MQASRRGVLRGAAALAGTSLAGCAGGRANTIRATFAPLGFRSLYETIARAFERSHPGWFVELEGSRSYEELAEKTLREAIVEDLPDISHQGLHLVRMLFEKGVAQPLDNLVVNHPEWRGLGYLEAVRSFGEIGGRVAALPFAISTPVIFYNLRLVAEAGWDVAHLPSSWNGILALAGRIRRLNRPGTMSLYFDYGASGGLTFQSMIFGAGGQMTTPDERQPAFGGSIGQSAMDLIAAFHDVGQIDVSREQATQAFAAGALGIYFSTSSNLRRLREQAGDRFGVAMCPFPVTVPLGRTPAAGNAIASFTRNKDRQPMAAAYIRFALSPEVQALMATRTGYLPTNRLAIRSPRYLASLYASDLLAAVPLRQLSVLRNWYAFPGSNGLKINRGLSIHMQEVVTGRARPQDALAAMMSETRELMRTG